MASLCSRSTLAGGCRIVGILVLSLALSSCRRPADTAAPVATPTVTLDRAQVSVGSPADIHYRFVVAADAPAFAKDYWVFVHFLDRDGELMWTDDHAPTTPTRQWKAGATIEYTRTMFIPKFPYTGETRVEVGLFSTETGDRLPMSGNNAGMRSYQVATFNLGLPADNTFVVFNSGWNETETADDASGVEWQWSKREATLSFRNPKRDAELFLQLDQPVRALPEPQQVELRIGTTPLDHFPLPVGERLLRRLPISAAQLGGADTVELVIAVDRSFVPASIPELRSTDPRELGVRVFRAVVEPR